MAAKSKDQAKYILFHSDEAPIQSVLSDLFTFAFLMLCIWFSWHMGGGFWTFITCAIFLLSLSVKLDQFDRSKWIRLGSKKEAIEWANALPDDHESVTSNVK